MKCKVCGLETDTFTLETHCALVYQKVVINDSGVLEYGDAEIETYNKAICYCIFCGGEIGTLGEVLREQQELLGD